MNTPDYVQESPEQHREAPGSPGIPAAPHSPKRGAAFTRVEGESHKDLICLQEEELLQKTDDSLKKLTPSISLPRRRRVEVEKLGLPEL